MYLFECFAYFLKLNLFSNPLTFSYSYYEETEAQKV